MCEVDLCDVTSMPNLSQIERGRCQNDINSIVLTWNAIAIPASSDTELVSYTALSDSLNVRALGVVSVSLAFFFWGPSDIVMCRTPNGPWSMRGSLAFLAGHSVT